MKLNEINIQEKTKMVVETIVKSDNGFAYFEDMLKTFDSDDAKIIKEKMDNLVILLGNVESKGEMEEFENLDFETEIWKMI